MPPSPIINSGVDVVTRDNVEQYAEQPSNGRGWKPADKRSGFGRSAVQELENPRES